MAKWALYLDESGVTEAHHLPLKNGETPVFTLGGVTLPCDSWRNYDREFLYLKREFFAKEINASSQNDTIWEAKGNYLLGPRNKESIRNRMFVFRVMDLVRKFDGKILGVSFVKSANAPMAKSSMYTKAFQIIAERYEAFLRQEGESGIIIADSRMAHLKKGGGLDYTVAISFLSYVFGHLEGQQLKNIIEAPLFADSQLTVGLQIADIISMLIYTNTYRTKIAIQENDTNGYQNYSYTSVFYDNFKSLIFEGTPSRKMFGLRVIDHSNS